MSSLFVVRDEVVLTYRGRIMNRIKHPVLVGTLLLVVAFGSAFLLNLFHLAQGDSFVDVLLRSLQVIVLVLGMHMILLPLLRKITR